MPDPVAGRGRGARAHARGRRLRHRPRDRRGPLRRSRRTGERAARPRPRAARRRRARRRTASRAASSSPRPCAARAATAARAPRASPDACFTGDYVERGITRLHGFARELVAEDAGAARPGPRVARPPRASSPSRPRSARGRSATRGRSAAASRGRRGARSCSAAARSGCSRPSCCGWTGSRSGRRPAPRRARRRPSSSRPSARTYVSVAETPPAALARSVGGFDLVVEAAGDAQLMLGSARPAARAAASPACSGSTAAGSVALDGRVLGVDAILEQPRRCSAASTPTATTGARPSPRSAAARARWPDALEAFVGLRVPLDRFADAFAFRGVKATLAFDVS